MTQCSVCTTPIGGLGVLENFQGICPVCREEFSRKRTVVQHTSYSGNQHFLQPVANIYCQHCGTPVAEILLDCKNPSLDVTEEFMSLRRK